MVLPHRSEWHHTENLWNTSALSKGEPNELGSLSLIPIYLLTACTGQQGKEQRGSSWNDASTWGFWQPSAAGAWGLLWSCQQVKHSAVFLRAAETWCALSPPLAELSWPCLAPCLGWGRFNPLGPNGSPRLGQAWGAVLLYLARRKKSHQLLAIAETLRTDFAFTTDHLTAMIARLGEILSESFVCQAKGLATSKAPH